MTGRRRPLAVLISLIALAAGSPAAAQPYRWVDAHGAIHYSDRPPQQGAAKIENMNPAARHRGAPAPPPGAAEPARSTPEPAEPSRSTPAPPAASPPPTAGTSPARPAVPARQTPRAEIEPTATIPAAVTTDGDAAAPARELMRLSGVDQWLERIVTLARDEFSQLGWRLDDAEAAWSALARGFRRDEMTPVADRCLLGGLPVGEREAALARLRSPLVQRAQRLREEAENPARGKEYRRFVSRLPDAPPPSTRVAIIQTLERESGAASFEIEMQRAVHRAVNNILRPLMNRDRHAPEETDTPASRAAEDETVRFRSVTMRLFAYRGLSRDDLEELVRLARSPGRARFVELHHDCIQAALTAAERRASLEVRPLAAGRRDAR